MKNNIKVIFGVIVIILLMLLLFFATSEKNKVKSITFNQIGKLVNEEDFVFIYNGQLNKDINNFAKSIKKGNRVVTYQINLSDQELSDLSSGNVKIEKDGYIVYTQGSLVGFISNELSDDKKMEYVKKYLYGYIPEEERYYQVLSTASEYIKKFNSNNYNVAVFGAAECSHCNLYLPVINEVARKNNLSIYYFDRNNYDVKEYEKIMDLDFTIPGTCTQSGEETTLGTGFDEPLTVITKKGKLVGCIKGYVTERVLTEKLEEFKLVKEGK